MSDLTNAVDKLVVTNFAAIAAKYGSVRRRLGVAIRAMVAADAQRGITTALVDLSSPRQLRAVDATAVSDASDPVQAKAAVDALCDVTAPDYVLLLGGPDIVPHVPLVNPLASARDPDAHVPSDLPYACAEPTSDDIASFVGPARVVGRLPDVPAATQVDVLVGLMQSGYALAQRASRAVPLALRRQHRDLADVLGVERARPLRCERLRWSSRLPVVRRGRMIEWLGRCTSSTCTAPRARRCFSVIRASPPQCARPIWAQRSPPARWSPPSVVSEPSSTTLRCRAVCCRSRSPTSPPVRTATWGRRVSPTAPGRRTRPRICSAATSPRACSRARHSAGRSSRLDNAMYASARSCCRST